MKPMPSNLKALLIDLDDCLYRQEAIPRLVKEYIQEYMCTLGIPKEEVPSVCAALYLKHGTTLAGLVANGYKIDFDDWHARVHAPLDYQQLLHSDVLIREILCSIDLPKYILTNADTKHARKCLERIGISDCFEGVFDFEWAQAFGKEQGVLSAELPVLCKPQPQIYELALKATNCKPDEVIFFDDSVRNVTSAHNEFGIFTVLVGKEGPVQGADVVIPTFHQLPNALPGLFTPKQQQQQQQQQ